MLFRYSALWALLFCSLSSSGMTQSITTSDQLVVSNCMLKPLADKVRIIHHSAEFSIIETTLNKEILTILHENKSKCGKFFNLDAYHSSRPQSTLSAEQLIKKFTQNKEMHSNTSYPVQHEKQVYTLYELIDPSKIWQSNQHLTSYLNRSAKTTSGIAAAHWFKLQFDTLAKEYGRTDVDSYFVTTGKKYPQPSVVTVIGKNKAGAAIVIGAHVDTLDGNMPGADDDSSGIAVTLEIARTLLASEIQLDNPVYLIAYAAEERGLVGSGYVVRHFIQHKIPVKAVMQLDQAGFRANPRDKTIWLLKDYVDANLTQFLAQLLTEYVKIPVGYTRCGYACSDHANWTKEGFSACYPSATTLNDDNPFIHSSEDKLDIINLEHMVNFTKLGLAFVAELGLK
ncbi:M20/M25/M40 family metallo-hydrolase [Legionella worsleiensis]|uniref:Leucine aminopeptidase n=1 Tax=Legionella worsleiensis TaxID=45076 RepID=A0A0W1AE92_9GAMM|nr:M20/M25/M40 family metallo-hydrolase [Legionella worsleiensis]KTD79654.1 leucine aminopeptidase [Legionella worsleiensis]STY32164.1 leucine aminopeptidase [Legionella worsleiensis]